MKIYLCFQVLLCITKNSMKHQLYIYTQLNDQTVLFQTIQFSTSTQFKCQTVLFDPWIGHYQVLPHQASAELGAMAMMEWIAISKAPASQEPRYQIIQCHIQVTCWGEYYPSAEMLSMYFPALANWAKTLRQILF